jgi:hypothetical protein
MRESTRIDGPSVAQLMYRLQSFLESSLMPVEIAYLRIGDRSYAQNKEEEQAKLSEDRTSAS